MLLLIHYLHLWDRKKSVDNIVLLSFSLVRSINGNPRDLSNAEWNAIVFLSRYHTTKYTHSFPFAAPTHFNAGSRENRDYNNYCAVFVFLFYLFYPRHWHRDGRENLEAPLISWIFKHMLLFIFVIEHCAMPCGGKLIFGPSGRSFYFLNTPNSIIVMLRWFRWVISCSLCVEAQSSSKHDNVFFFQFIMYVVVH